MSQFDADALERAAKAARELESSKNVKALLELSKREAEVKKAVEDRKAAEANAQRAGYAKEQEVVRWEEQRKTLQYNKQLQQVGCVPGARFLRGVAGPAFYFVARCARWRTRCTRTLHAEPVGIRSLFSHK